MSDFTDRIKPDDDGITTYLEDLRKGRYQIPTFQRQIVWEAGNVKKLWDSIYKFYPLGSVLVWRTDVMLQRHRQVGGHALTTPTDGEFQYILDGQQRTTALLTSIYGGQIEGRENFNPALHIDLTVGLADETDDENFSSMFLFWNEIDDRDGELLKNTGRMQRWRDGLIVPLKSIKQAYGEVEERLERAGHGYDDLVRINLRRMRTVFDNYRISFIHLRGIQVSEVCQIFERINQAGMPLDIFDIVVAKTFLTADIHNDEPGFYLRDLFDEFRDTIPGNYSQVDNHTTLQMVAVAIGIDVEDSGVHNITDRYLNEPSRLRAYPTGVA